MSQTLVGVIVGGALAIVSQLMIDVLRAKSERHRERSAALAIARVQQLHLYAVQHLLKESLETGRWWPREVAWFSLPNDQDLRALTLLLPDNVWRGYTGAIRRVTACANLRTSASEDTEVMDTPMIQRLLGAYVTVDHARRVLGPVTGTSPSDIELGPVVLSVNEIDEALRLYGSTRAPLVSWSKKVVSVRT